MAIESVTVQILKRSATELYFYLGIGFNGPFRIFPAGYFSNFPNTGGASSIKKCPVVLRGKRGKNYQHFFTSY